MPASYAPANQAGRRRSIPTSSLSQAITTEGKYWKSRIEFVIREYHKWRTYFKKRVSLWAPARARPWRRAGPRAARGTGPQPWCRLLSAPPAVNGATCPTDTGWESPLCAPSARGQQGARSPLPARLPGRGGLRASGVHVLLGRRGRGPRALGALRDRLASPSLQLQQHKDEDLSILAQVSELGAVRTLMVTPAAPDKR